MESGLRDISNHSLNEADAILVDDAEIFVGGCNSEGRPCICRALAGERIDAWHVVIVCSRVDGAEALQAIRETRRVAVYITARQSMRSLQLKDNQARLLDSEERWDALVERRRQAVGLLEVDADSNFGIPLAFVATQRHAAICCRLDGHLLPTHLAMPDEINVRSQDIAADEPTAQTGLPGRMAIHVQHLLETGYRPVMCTVSSDGMPHLCRVASAEYIDEHHIAVSLADDENARRNLLERVWVALCVSESNTAPAMSMQAVYLNTACSGPVPDRLRARATVAAWRLGAKNAHHFHGAYTLKVETLNRAYGNTSPSAPRPCRPLAAGTRCLSQYLSLCARLEELLSTLATGLEQHLGLARSKLWASDPQRRCLTLLASHGYPVSSADVDVPIGIGPVGIAAMAKLPVRIDHLPLLACGSGDVVDAREPISAAAERATGAITCPETSWPCCQLALPLLVQGRVVGVLFVEGKHPRHIDADDEDALASIAAQLASSLAILHLPVETVSGDASCPSLTAREALIDVRYYEHDCSVFLDETYLIKGVSGALLWKLVRNFVQCGRSEFTTRELQRCASELRLPAVHDNLYTRLLLLQRRLAERAAPIQIERTGPGRFRVRVSGTLRLSKTDVR